MFKKKNNGANYIGYDRIQSLFNRINDNWDLTISKEKQLEMVETIRTSVVTFSSISLTTKELVSENDFFRSRQEFMHLLSSNLMGRTFPPDFLNRLFDAVEDMEEIFRLILPALEGIRYDVKQWEGCILSLLKVCSSTKLVLFMMDTPQWNPCLKNSGRYTGEAVTQTLLGMFLNIDSTTHGLCDLIFNGVSPAQDRMKMHTAFQDFRGLVCVCMCAYIYTYIHICMYIVYISCFVLKTIKTETRCCYMYVYSCTAFKIMSPMFLIPLFETKTLDVDRKSQI
ncbi:hypothetical protein RFI_09586 [Reticulomyxa filosa]|uniref:Uncharacterized protein n=1 Tax=Reticulomyxa filosa TaxID=46433 RepID=X6NNN5_RETFI|nr:hypothetical protein RFI_09586 [Reticulomyxa filosa]|eukprot:ETO27548.1 hypothetical protein RFI_09586 [Reticulomyxa filosa]